MQPVPAGAPGASGQVILPPAGARRGLTSQGALRVQQPAGTATELVSQLRRGHPECHQGPILGEGLGPVRLLHAQAGRAVPGPDLSLRGGSWAGVEEVFGLPCARAGTRRAGPHAAESRHQAGPTVCVSAGRALVPRRPLHSGVSGEGSRACLEPYSGQMARETWSQDRTRAAWGPGVTEPWAVPRGAPAALHPQWGDQAWRGAGFAKNREMETAAQTSLR